MEIGPLWSRGMFLSIAIIINVGSIHLYTLVWTASTSSSTSTPLQKDSLIQGQKDYALHLLHMYDVG